MEREKIEELVKMAKAYQLQEIEIKEGENSIRIVQNTAPNFSQPYIQQQVPFPTSNSDFLSSQTTEKDPLHAEAKEKKVYD